MEEFEKVGLAHCPLEGWTAVVDGTVDGGMIEWARRNGEPDLGVHDAEYRPIRLSYSYKAFMSLAEGSSDVLEDVYENGDFVTWGVATIEETEAPLYMTYQGLLTPSETEGSPLPWSGTTAQNGPLGRHPVYMRRWDGGRRVVFPLVEYFTGEFYSVVVTPLRLSGWVAGGLIALRPYYFFRQENDDNEWYVTPVDASGLGSLGGGNAYKLGRSGVRRYRLPRSEVVPRVPVEQTIYYQKVL